LLTRIAYAEVPHESVEIPERVHNADYIHGPIPMEMYIPSVY